MHIIYAPEEAMNRDGKAFDEVSDAVDEGQSKISTAVLTINSTIYSFNFKIVNVLKLKQKQAWDEKSKFDTEKDKTAFRNYEEACDRVKNFYKEQHGRSPAPLILYSSMT